LCQLTSTSNPENVTVSYQYDADGNLTQKTDARNTITAFTYNNLNQILTKTYTLAGTTDTTPNVTYNYEILQSPAPAAAIRWPGSVR
jgi:YD repeat-containing protein